MDKGEDQGACTSDALLAWSAAGARAGLDGHEQFIRRFGASDAPPNDTLLILHGFPESSFSFRKIIDTALTRFSQIVLVDHLGFGLSDKPLVYTYSLFEQADRLVRLWKTLGVQGGHVLAHDMGDSIATELMARQAAGMGPVGFEPGLLSVTVTNGNMVMEEARLTLGQKLALNPLTGPAFGQWIRYPMFAQQVQRAHGATGLSQADLRDLWALNQMNQGSRISHKVIQYLKERYRFQNTRWLPGFVAFDGPVHICWGARDTVAPVTVAHRLKALKPEARLSIFDDVGHFAQLQADPQWSAALMDFWNAA